VQVYTIGTDKATGSCQNCVGYTHCGALAKKAGGARSCLWYVQRERVLKRQVR